VVVRPQAMDHGDGSFSGALDGGVVGCLQLGG